MKKKIKIILKQNIRRIGNAGESINVAKGFYVNYLQKRNLAIRYTEDAFNNFQKTNIVDEKLVEEAKKIASKVENLYIYFARSNIIKANSKDGILYGSITTKDIENEINKLTELNISKDNIDLSEKIKMTGVYKASLVLYNGVSAKFNISVASTIEEAKVLVAEYIKAQEGEKNVG